MPEFTDWISGASDPVITDEEIDIIAGALAPSLADIIDAAGVLPVGGTAAQVLAKIDNTNFNTEWVDQTGGTGYSPAARVKTGTAITLAVENDQETMLFAPTTPSDNVVVTIPTNATLALDIGFTVTLFAQDVGGVSLSTSGITLRGDSPYTNISVNEAMFLQKIGTDNWLVIGGTS